MTRILLLFAGMGLTNAGATLNVLDDHDFAAGQTPNPKYNHHQGKPPNPSSPLMPAISSLDRRRFLKLTLGSTAFAGAGFRMSSAFAYGTQGSLYRSLVPEGATPAAKGIDAAWLASLRVRESAGEL